MQTAIFKNNSALFHAILDLPSASRIKTAKRQRSAKLLRGSALPIKQDAALTANVNQMKSVTSEPSDVKPPQADVVQSKIALKVSLATSPQDNAVLLQAPVAKAMEIAAPQNAAIPKVSARKSRKSLLAQNTPNVPKVLHADSISKPAPRSLPLSPSA